MTATTPLPNAALKDGTVPPQTAPAHDPLLLHVTAANFATGPLKRQLLVAFLVLSETGKTVRTLYTNPGPKHVVTNRFPVQRFVFPSSPDAPRRSLSFTFVLTNGEGQRVYGHTMHTVSGEAMVCLSAFPWCAFFQHVMHLYRVNGPECGQKMIRTLLDGCNGVPSGVPRNGALLPVAIGGRRLQSPLDAISPFVDTMPATLLQTFTTHQLFDVIAALLTERRVIVLGPTYGAVSSVMLSLLAVLTPFEWQHTLITILPPEMGLVLAAPTPYFVGLVDAQRSLLERTPIEGVVVVTMSHTPSKSQPGTLKLVCDDILYYNEERVTLPHTSMASSKVWWRLQLLKRSSMMKRIHRSFELDVADQYPTNRQHDHHHSAHEVTCQIFASYFASWLGPAIAAHVHQRAVASSGVNNAQEEANASFHANLEGGNLLLTAATSSERKFFDALTHSQCYCELLDRLATQLAPRSDADGDDIAPWYTNPFLVSVVRGNPSLFVPQLGHLATTDQSGLMHDDDGVVSGSSVGSSVSSNSSRQSSTLQSLPKTLSNDTVPSVYSSSSGAADVRPPQPAAGTRDGPTLKSVVSVPVDVGSAARRSGAASLSQPAALAHGMHDKVRVRNLLMRSMRCCHVPVDELGDVELNDLTPASANSAP